MSTPQPFVDQLKEIIQTTSDEVLGCLQRADKRVKAINFIHGPAEEIRETLKQYDKSNTLCYKKYPLIVLITPFTTQRGNVGGYYDKVICNIGIAHHTKKEYKSDERYEQVINGVLTPLYECLLETMADSGYFAVNTPENIRHTPVIRTDIGRKPFLNIDGMSFDYIDAIELQNVELTRHQINCLTQTNNC